MFYSQNIHIAFNEFRDPAQTHTNYTEKVLKAKPGHYQRNSGDGTILL